MQMDDLDRFEYSSASTSPDFIGAARTKPKERLCEPWVNGLLKAIEPKGATAISGQGSVKDFV